MLINRGLDEADALTIAPCIMRFAGLRPDELAAGIQRAIAQHHFNREYRLW